MNNRSHILILAAATLLASLVSQSTDAQSVTLLRNISRIKGQEENVLRGVGLVVGLNGTGETGDAATIAALAKSLEIMGNPVSQSGRIDEQTIEALKNVKNVALAIVTATVPASGARRGDKLDCHVSAINGKSLNGGQLMAAALQGPNTQDKTVFALCQGPIHIEDESRPMVGMIHNGCQMEQDVITKFVTDDGYVTIVLDRNHADFLVATEVAESLSSNFAETFLTKELEKGIYDEQQQYVKAVNAANIIVKVPELYRDDVVTFIAELMGKTIYSVEPEARVIVNPRTGNIVIDGDVEIGDIVYTHKNLVVETGNSVNFLEVAPGQSDDVKLQRLVQALANLRVPAKDVIEIIQGIERMGKLHAKLIVL